MAFKSTTRQLGSFSTKFSTNEPDSDEDDMADYEDIDEEDELDDDISEIELDDDIDEIDLGTETTTSKQKTSNKKLPPQIKTRSFLGAEPIMTKREIVPDEINIYKCKSDTKAGFANEKSSSYPESSGVNRSQGFNKETSKMDEGKIASIKDFLRSFELNDQIFSLNRR